MKSFFKNNSDKICADIIVGVVLIAFYFLISKIEAVGKTLSFAVSVLSPFLIGFVIAYFLLPFVRKTQSVLQYVFLKATENRLTKKLKTKNTAKTKKDGRLSQYLSVFLVYVLVAIVVAFLINQLIPQIVESIVTFVNNIPYYFNVIKDFTDDILTKYNHNDWIIEQSKIYNKAFEYITELAQGFLNWIFKLPKVLTGGVTNFIVGFILSVYFVLDCKRFKEMAKRVTEFLFPDKHSAIFYVGRKADNYVSKFFMGKIIDSLIIGLIAFPFMIIIYKPYALLISVIIGITNIVPYFGPIVGAVPGGLIILINAPEKIIWYVIFVFVLQQFDGNILGPKILGESTGLSPVGVIFGIIVGGKLFGFLGMLLGVPFTAIVCSLFEELIDKKLSEKENTGDMAEDEITVSENE